LNVTTRYIMEWGNGKRKEFVDNGIGGESAGSATNAAPILPKLFDLTRCAKCEKKRDDLQTCSRCRKAAYCDRGKSLGLNALHRRVT